MDCCEFKLLQPIFCFYPNTWQDLPYFQDHKLARKRNGVLRQPYVKEPLDQAREKAASAT